MFQKTTKTTIGSAYPVYPVLIVVYRSFLKTVNFLKHWEFL